MATGTLTSKGQVTIPKEVRDRMGLTEGDRLEFVFDEQGRLIVRPEATDPLGRLPGLLKHLARERPVSVEEMREAVLRRAKEKYGAGGEA
jgi:AbrB family looped-hinge helix DNA binding protein